MTKTLIDQNPPSEAPSTQQKMAELLARGERKNTKSTYDSSIKHFVDVWHGLLPATELEICRYLTEMSDQYKVNTLNLRLSALAQWHKSFGFPDYTKSPLVKQLMRGIRGKHGQPPRQADPLTLVHLRAIVSYLDGLAAGALQVLHEPLPGSCSDEVRKEREALFTVARKDLLRASRDKALLLIGFWRAFRSDEISRMDVEHIQATKGHEMKIFLTQSKTDREAQGKTYLLPALKELCPVTAYTNWLEDSGIVKGPVFRSINRWGRLQESGLNTKSIDKILKRFCREAGVNGQMSTHSMRHGFANWASDEGWELYRLMKYVGWSNAANAERYIRPFYDFGDIGLTRDRLSERSSKPINELGTTIAGSAVREDELDV
ncbi:site-specific integrase [Pseudomonas frederiksbergensis]